MIPLQDPQGRVIGFTARQIRAGDYGPKYINTPQTPLYDKSRHIFGMHLAKNAIRENKYVVVAEGNLDVISSHQVGVRQVVATAGTAITEAHLKGLSRFVTDIRLCLDSDKAGVSATERAIDIASKLHISLNIITLDEGKDPDELIRRDPTLWRKTVNNFTYAIDWLIEFHQANYDLRSAEGKRRFTDIILPAISKLDDAVEKDHYLNLIAKLTDISREALDAKLAGTVTVVPKPLVKPKVDIKLEPKEQVELAKCEDHLLCLMIKHPELRAQLDSIRQSMLTREKARELLGQLKSQPELSDEQLIRLDTLEDYVKIELLQYEELYQGLELSEIRYEANRMQARLIEHYVKRQKLNIAKQLQSADDQLTESLLNKARQLDELLKNNLGENNNAQEK